MIDWYWFVGLWLYAGAGIVTTIKEMERDNSTTKWSGLEPAPRFFVAAFVSLCWPLIMPIIWMTND